MGVLPPMLAQTCHPIQLSNAFNIILPLSSYYIPPPPPPDRNSLLLSQFAFNYIQFGMLGLEWKTTSSFFLIEDDLKYFCEWKTTSIFLVNGR